MFYDRGNLVESAVGTVTKALAEATVLVLILLVLFLGDLRAALTVALILPLAALATFILMNAFGLSANLMSLGGLAIAIGMLVDAAVVVVENVVTTLSQHGERAKLPRLHLIYRASKEVAVPVTSGILIIVIVFLPLLTLQGLEGKLFGPVALTIVFALTASLAAVADRRFRYLPRICWASRHTTIRGWCASSPPSYLPLLRWSLNHSRAVVIAAVALLIAAGGLYTQVGKAFMPSMDEGDLIVQLEKLPSINLEKSIDLDLRVQRAIMQQVPEVTGIVARTGSDELGLDPMGLNQTDSFLVLKPREQWRMQSKDELIDAIRKVLDEFPGVDYAFTQPIEMRVSEMLTGVRGDLAIKIFGGDQDALNRTAESIVSVVQADRGRRGCVHPAQRGCAVLPAEGRPAGRRAPRARCRRRWKTACARRSKACSVGTVYEGARRTPLVIRGPADLRGSAAVFGALQLTLADGQRVPLSSLVTLERTEGPVAIQRERGNRMAVVVANVGGRDLVGFVDEARQRSPNRCSCRPATTTNGAASSRTSNAPRNVCRSLCRWRSA